MRFVDEGKKIAHVNENSGKQGLPFLSIIVYYYGKWRKIPDQDSSSQTQEKLLFTP
jgi:hypothetical protein